MFLWKGWRHTSLFFFWTKFAGARDELFNYVFSNSDFNFLITQILQWGVDKLSDYVNEHLSYLVHIFIKNNPNDFDYMFKCVSNELKENNSYFIVCNMFETLYAWPFICMRKFSMSFTIKRVLHKWYNLCPILL